MGRGRRKDWSRLVDRVGRAKEFSRRKSKLAAHGTRSPKKADIIRENAQAAINEAIRLRSTQLFKVITTLAEASGIPRPTKPDTVYFQNVIAAIPKLIESNPDLVAEVTAELNKTNLAIKRLLKPGEEE